MMNTKGNPIWFKSTLLGMDMLAAASGSAFAYILRFQLLEDFVPARGEYFWSDYMQLLPAGMFAWFLALYISGMYGDRQRVLAWKDIRKIFQSALGASGILLAYVFFAKPISAAGPDVLASYSRMLLIVWLFCTFCFVVITRWAADRLIHHLRRHHHMAMGRVALAGSGESVRAVAKIFRQYPEYGRHVVGIVLPPNASSAKTISRLPVLGNTTELLELVRRHEIDEVIIAQPNFPASHLRELLTQCEKDLVEFKIVPDLTEMLFTDVQVEEIDGIPFLGLRQTPLTGWNLPAKRLFDIVVALVLLIVLAVPMAVFAWLIRRGSPGPILYRQNRIGADGREFIIYKFRSMVQNAEDLTGPVFSGEEDPRVTRIGKFLRRHRIDEWPQLFNVLRGDMSLVGPRPERPFFVNRFKEIIPRYMGRHRVKSGVTGWAQVNGLCGPHGSIEQRLRYDIRYIEQWSWWLDLAIILRTIPLFFGSRKPDVDSKPGDRSELVTDYTVTQELSKSATEKDAIEKLI